MNTSTLRPVDELLWSLPYIVDAAPNDWVRDFVLSILGKARRPGWKPSTKQHVILNKVVAEHYATRGRIGRDSGGDFDLIEA
ncbi:MAG: hypothetical protein ACK5KO_06495 [Arachnia sp.]